MPFSPRCSVMNERIQRIKRRVGFVPKATASKAAVCSPKSDARACSSSNPIFKEDPMSTTMQQLRAIGLFAVIALCVLARCSGTALGQTETGQITGKVVDPNGAVVAKASVTVKSKSTGATRTATSSADGFYTVTNLQPGIYEV